MADLSQHFPSNFNFPIWVLGLRFTAHSLQKTYIGDEWAWRYNWCRCYLSMVKRTNTQISFIAPKFRGHKWRNQMEDENINSIKTVRAQVFDVLSVYGVDRLYAAFTMHRMLHLSQTGFGQFRNPKWPRFFPIGFLRQWHIRILRVHES